MWLALARLCRGACDVSAARLFCENQSSYAAVALQWGMYTLKSTLNLFMGGVSMERFAFYYDETEHSRVINSRTISAENYYDGFIAAVVGWKERDREEIELRFRYFADKHSRRKTRGELKSTTLKQEQLVAGFASLSKDAASFVSDFLDLFDDKVLIYLAKFSKVEHLVNQLFANYENSLFCDMTLARYSIVKAIDVYRPREVIEAIDGTPSGFVAALRAFLLERIEKDAANVVLKSAEISQFEQLLYVIDGVAEIDSFNWEYEYAFIGLKKFLEEKEIANYSLVIDKEARTADAAREVGIEGVFEGDSKVSFGLQVADLLAGLTAKLMKALSNDLAYKSEEETTEKNLINKKWFDLTEERFELYKKFHRVLMRINNAWYKMFTGCSADDLICLTTLLSFIVSFKSAKDLRANLEVRPEHYNFAVLNELQRHYSMMHGNLSVLSDYREEAECCSSSDGAIEHFGVGRPPRLCVKGARTCCVLSVEIGREGPTATVLEAGGPACYMLPASLAPWVEALVAAAHMDVKLLPAMVTFTNLVDGIAADIH